MVMESLPDPAEDVKQKNPKKPKKSHKTFNYAKSRIYNVLSFFGRGVIEVLVKIPTFLLKPNEGGLRREETATTHRIAIIRHYYPQNKRLPYG